MYENDNKKIWRDSLGWVLDPFPQSEVVMDVNLENN